MQKEKSTKKNAFGGKKLILWMLLFVAITAVTFWAVSAQSADFSVGEFLADLKNADPKYLCGAVIAMLGYVLFEGLAVLVICRAMGYRRRIKDGFIYSASDIYFSAITPSASGGQPASIWFMVQDGIPATTAVAALVANLVCYTLAIVVIGGVTFLCAPAMFLEYSTLSKILIVAGYITLTLLAVLFLLLLRKGNWVYALAQRLIRLLAKCRLVKRQEKWEARLQSSLQRYQGCAELLLHRKKAILLTFLLNLLQRASQITVTSLALLATGGSGGQAGQAWFAQSYGVIGSNCVPIPGAMGVSDYLLLDGLGNMMAAEQAVRLDLLSRALSFYSMILICGIAILVKYILILQRKWKSKEEPI